MNLALWLLAVAALAFLAFGLTFVFYVFVMAVKPKLKTLHPVVKAVAAPWAAFGYLVMDMLVVNVGIGTVLFLQLPRHGTFSARINENERLEGGGWLTRWRRKCATWICREFLRPFDEDHC